MKRGAAAPARAGFLRGNGRRSFNSTRMENPVLIDDLIQKQQRSQDRARRRQRRANFAHSKATAYSVRRALVELDMRGSIDSFFARRDQYTRMADQYNRRARLLNDSAITILVRGTL